MGRSLAMADVVDLVNELVQVQSYIESGVMILMHFKNIE